MLIFIIFIVIPLIEISLFISVGEEIGLAETLLLCFLTAMIGGYFVKQQGISTLINVQHSVEKGGFPAQEIFDGICIVVAGATLITPGFFTDAVGFLLLVPAFRQWIRPHIAKMAEKHMHIHTYSSRAHHNNRDNDYNTIHDPDVIDADYERLDEKDDRRG